MSDLPVMLCCSGLMRFCMMRDWRFVLLDEELEIDRCGRGRGGR